jgi:hypothetical protein
LGGIEMPYEFSMFSKEHDYWLGTDPESRRHLLGIPVSNSMVDYIETYWLEDEQYKNFLEHEDSAIQFADACRRRQHDDLLTHRPGTRRGTPR